MDKVIFGIIAFIIAFVLFTANDAVMTVLHQAKFAILLILLSGVILAGGYVLTTFLMFFAVRILNEKNQKIFQHGLPWVFLLAFWLYGWSRMH